MLEIKLIGLKTNIVFPPARGGRIIKVFVVNYSSKRFMLPCNEDLRGS